MRRGLVLVIAALSGMGRAEGASPPIVPLPAHIENRPGSFAPEPVRRIKRDLPPEAYVLTVDQSGAAIEAGSEAGFFYGEVTLDWLKTQGRTIPGIRIEDSPRFAWRGLMLDSARHFQPVAFIKQFIDWMALLKFNRFHWHLVDDQGWRIEIGKYPELTAKSAWRADGGGFYSKAQLRDIVAYAAARQVTIVPEIEMPGHALAAIAAYPQFGSAADPPRRIEARWGVFPYLYNAEDQTFGFLEDVLVEVMELFPGPYIHVGGDEAIKNQWRASPEIQAAMKRLGIDNEEGLQSWFMTRIGAFLNAHGRREIGWDEILDGGLPPNAIVMSWRGTKGAERALAQGHDAILSPFPMLYFDNRQSASVHEPPGRGAVISLRDVYQFAASPDRVLGVQGNIWTEHMRLPDQVMRMTYPRAAALSEVAWSAADARNFDDFLRRWRSIRPRLRAKGLQDDESSFEPIVDARLDADGEHAEISLSSAMGLHPLVYRIDDGIHDYEGPFRVKLPLTLEAWAPYGPHVLRRMDERSLQRRSSRQLGLCTGKLPLALDGGSRVYFVDIMDPCWIFPQARLDGVTRIEVAQGALPFNFELADDRAHVVTRPAPETGPALEVRLDRCDGDLLVRLPIGKGGRLTRPIPPISGRHDLCLAFAAGSVDPLNVIDWVALQ